MRKEYKERIWGELDDMKTMCKTGVLFFFIILITILSGACGGSQGITGGREAAVEFFGMNTYMKLTAYGDGAEDALERAESKVAELESLWSATDRQSEIYQINHSAGQPADLSEETKEVISFALKMAKQTDGALEPTIYPVLTAWGFTTEENRIPDEAEIAKLLTRVGYERVEFSDGRIWLQEGMELDLGAVGKGYTGDILTELLKESGISSAILDLGGNIQTIGSKPDGSEWKLGIRNPFGEGSIGVLSVAGDTAVVTSGNYERYFVGGDGKEYGHIIDPDTGYPVDNELASVTIISEEGKLADALSTSMMVKGLAGAIEYWRAHRDFEMIAVTKDREIYLTQKAKEAFVLSDAFGNMEIKEVE